MGLPQPPAADEANGYATDAQMDTDEYKNYSSDDHDPPAADILEHGLYR